MLNYVEDAVLEIVNDFSSELLNGGKGMLTKSVTLQAIVMPRVRIGNNFMILVVC